MTTKAFQDYYPSHFSHCHGCGRLHELGMQIKSDWDGDETACVHVPKTHNTDGAADYPCGGGVWADCWRQDLRPRRGGPVLVPEHFAPAAAKK